MTSADLISSSLAESHIITAYLGFNLGILLISAEARLRHSHTAPLDPGTSPDLGLPELGRPSELSL